MPSFLGCNPVESHNCNRTSSDSLSLSCQARTGICLPSVSTLADGIAVKQPGDITFRYTQKYVDELILVTEEELMAGILFMLERAKIITEGAGVAGVAALLAGKIKLPSKKVAVVVSGGNIDPLFLSLLIEDKYQQVASW
jgi:threonine dehydratase